MASCPKEKNAKKITELIGIDDQIKKVQRKTSGGISTEGNAATREKLLCTLDQLIQGRRPLLHVNHILKTMTRALQNI